MTISRISDNFQEHKFPELHLFTDNRIFRCYGKTGRFIGAAVKEGDNQWAFLPVGSEVWYDDESDLFVTRFSEPISDECVSEMREDVGAFVP